MQTVSDFILDRLAQWGIKRVFGYPGDGINGLMGAFGRTDALEFVQVRHEEMAAFMACGHAKFTGQVGVCMATSGPGAIHLAMACMTPGWTISRWWPLSASRRARRWAPATSRR